MVLSEWVVVSMADVRTLKIGGGMQTMTFGWDEIVAKVSTIEA